jgi:hypothetical protein
MSETSELANEKPADTFDDRQKSFEKKFERDQDLQFKVGARRNKLLGLWAAGVMDKRGADAEGYAKKVVLADFEKRAAPQEAMIKAMQLINDTLV